MSKTHWALLAATTVSIIYGLTFTLAKEVMPTYIQAYGFILLRVAGATALFWTIAPFGPKEKVARKDFPRIIAAAFFGVAFNMLTFFKGLSLTSPISASVLMVSTPMLVLILSAFLLGDGLRRRKIAGILIGAAGTVLLIAYGKQTDSAPQPALGNFLVFVNAASYAYYLIIVKKLMDRYNAFTFVKWIYTFGLLMVLPFGWSELQAVNWTQIPTGIWWIIAFVVVASTFLTYLLNLVSMRQLSPTIVAVFIYLQPVFATLFAIGLGKDQLTPVKIISALMIFTGVYWVTQKREA